MPADAKGALHIDQLLRTPYVIGVKSRIKATGAVFQNFYGLGSEGAVTEPPLPPGHDIAVWHYFDNTRTVGTIRPRLSGPSRPIAKPAGVAHAVPLRFYEALSFDYNTIAGYRALNKPIGFLSSQGEDWVTRQMGYLLQRHQNLREVAAARMIVNGGFDIKTSGNGHTHTVVATGDGQISVNYQIPANHKTQIALDTGGANVFTTSWANAAADAILQHAILRQVAERESGYTLKHVWITSKQAVNLINNTGLRNAGGSAFRVWESYVQQQMQTLQGMRERSADLVFRALPDWTFHCYDGVINLDQERDSTAEADTSLFIPNDGAIYTPEPGDWLGNIVAQEIVIEQHAGQPQTVTGLPQWKRRLIEPIPAEELHLLDNFLPILYVPKAVYQATTVF